MIASLLMLLGCLISVFFNNKKTIFVNFTVVSAVFLYLIYSHVVNDTTLMLVYLNSSIDMPALFRMSASWANHEGSILMWCWIVSLYSVLFSLFTKPTALAKMSARIQSLIVAALIIITVFSSNPLIGNDEFTGDGLGLNPILQDVAVTIHPPLLFVGYGGLGVVYACALAANITRTRGKDWVALAEPWLKFAWATLGLGIGIGSWWAYRELGWGGFWFWDPVENISLMPWLLTTALIHSASMVKRYDILNGWSFLLGTMAFASAILGTFLIRSGILLSVHSFSLDHYRGLYLLILVSAAFLLPLTALVVYSPSNAQLTQKFSLFSRPVAIMANNVLLCCCYFVILVSLLYPIICNYLLKQTVMIGAQYFNTSFLIIWLPLLLLCCSLNATKIYAFLAKYLASAIAIWFLTKNHIATAVLSAAALLVISSIKNLLFKPNNNSTYMHIGHLGLGILVAGIVICSQWQTEKECYMKIGDEVNFRDHSIALRELSAVARSNHQALRAIIIVDQHRTLTPESLFFVKAKMITPEPAIMHHYLSDIYIMIGDFDEKLGLAVKLYYRPAIQLIWLGIITIALAPLLSLIFGRGLRVQTYKESN